MFRKLLVANRGEIACRVMRTAHRLGIATVAVYSDADRGALHVRQADEAVRIGPPAARDSYLAIDRLWPPRATGADAVHPGYGFLSENADFAEACAAAGLVFVGPPAAIRAMGSKAEAKRLMEAAGVALLPGYHGEDQSPDVLRAAATRIGFPVLLKAVAGGGGRGMRRVDAAIDFDAALAACRREAASAFGDERVLVERWLDRPRHVEVQVFADMHGHSLHLFERDCSVQRRHQKVLEEAPAPALSADLRDALGKAAVQAARAVGYVGAGTVEFIVDRDGRFHFMEMNTRLQVEHPVTEMVTGLDLVEWQLRVAAGEALPLVQEQVTLDGHALEARLYAEDPARGFAPAAGRLLHLVLPAEDAGLRVDTGVATGDEIGVDYDPLVAKIITHGPDRAAALARLRRALAETQVLGVASNLRFLERLVACPAFSGADLDTTLIERERVFLFEDDTTPPGEVFLVAALALLAAEGAGRDGSPWSAVDGWRPNLATARRLSFDADGTRTTVGVAHDEAGFRLDLDGRVTRGAVEATGDGGLVVHLAGRRLRCTVLRAADRLHVLLDGRVWLVDVVDPLAHTVTEQAPDGDLRAPMPGTVSALLVAPGEAVAAGAPLLVLEAMKMEHSLHAPSAGRVARFLHAVGDRVTEGAALLEFLPDDAG